MLLRRVIEHVKAQNWTAVALDFFIVVVGVFIGIQVSNWNEDRGRRVSEREYLERLHSDVLELADRRAYYDRDRPITVRMLELITDFTNGYRDDLAAAHAYALQAEPTFDDAPAYMLDSYLCSFMDWSSALTIPPSELPTATELISAGRLDRVSSQKVKSALLSYLQQARRSQEFISAVLAKVSDLTTEYPDLFHIRYRFGEDMAISEGESYAAYSCSYDEMRDNNAFLNALNRNRSIFTEYFHRGVRPASERLTLLHAALDETLGVVHEEGR